MLPTLCLPQFACPGVLNFTLLQAIGEATRREQVAIPVYCYPAATSFRFPRHIVFDNVIVGSSRKRIFKLAVDIPVSFEFAISVNRQHTDFHVSPLTGTIPGNGAVDITILFEPCALQTHRIELTLTSSQFKSKPCTCTVLGTVKAGATRDQMIRAYTGDLPVTMTVLDSDNLVQDARKQVYPYSAKGGAGHGDPVTEAAWQARKKQSRSNPVVCIFFVLQCTRCILNESASVGTITAHASQKHSEGLSRAWTMPKPLNPTRVYHSTVARLLMDASKPDTGSESLTSNCDDAATSDSAWEHLSPFDNLALDTDTKVCFTMVLLSTVCQGIGILEMVPWVLDGDQFVRCRSHCFGNKRRLPGIDRKLSSYLGNLSQVACAL